MLKRRGARTYPCGKLFLRRRCLLHLPLAVVRVKLRFRISFMIMRNMRRNFQVEAASTAMTVVIKESVCFITVYCFFTVDCVKFLQ